jgi:hypothetical protein
LYLTFRRWDEALLIMGTLPFALTGGLWLLYWLGYNQSVATAVGSLRSRASRPNSGRHADLPQTRWRRTAMTT